MEELLSNKLKKGDRDLTTVNHSAFFMPVRTDWRRGFALVVEESSAEFQEVEDNLGLNVARGCTARLRERSQTYICRFY